MDKDDPTVSVVIPTYNRAEIIGRAIRSVQAQTFEDWELIVVDDASEDNTRGVVLSYNDKRIQYVKHEKNRGACAARNTGIRCSTGNFIALLDSDDEWKPNKLETQINTFERANSCVGLVYTGMKQIGRGSAKKNERVDKMNESLRLRNPIGSCSAVMLKRDVTKEVKMFDKTLPSSQDRDYWYRTTKKYTAKYDGEVNTIKHDSDDRMQILNDTPSVICGNIRFFEKHKNDYSQKERARHYFKMARTLRVKRKNKRLSSKVYLKKCMSVNPFTPKYIIYIMIHSMPIWTEKIIKRMLNRKNILTNSVKLLAGV